jgi:hypothetical protein
MPSCASMNTATTSVALSPVFGLIRWWCCPHFRFVPALHASMTASRGQIQIISSLENGLSSPTFQPQRAKISPQKSIIYRGISFLANIFDSISCWIKLIKYHFPTHQNSSSTVPCRYTISSLISISLKSQCPDTSESEISVFSRKTLPYQSSVRRVPMVGSKYPSVFCDSDTIISNIDRVCISSDALRDLLR